MTMSFLMNVVMKTLVLSAASVQLRFQSLSSADVLVDPQRKQPVLSFWLSKNNYSSQNALLWCLTRMQLSVWTGVWFPSSVGTDFRFHFDCRMFDFES